MDLMVLPSLWEGLPIVVLESFAHGVPVVATDIPGTRELVTNGVTGWLVQPADPDSLADGLLSALRDGTGRTRVREEARKKVVNFSVEKVAAQYKLLYEDLIEDKRA
jgi:glycosyltransferase involved in cell wall biosynthesis